jgi:hypothetical protein
MICENCGKEHLGNYGSGRFCSKECARSFSTKNVKHKELKITKCVDCGKDIYISKNASKINARCDDCKLQYDKIKFPSKYIGDIRKSKTNCNIFNNIKCEECYFHKHKICKSKSSIKQQFNTLTKYLNINVSTYEETLKQYLDIKQNIQSMIYDGFSANDICINVFDNPKHGNTIFKILQIKTRSLKDAVKNAYLQGKLGNEVILNQYKSGWHTTWNNKEVFLRSSYEFDFAIELDNKQIDYDVANLRIKYFDTQTQTYRCAIPDFFIKEQNTIIEIKSNWTLDVQNMKDKVKAYNNLGYNFKLICDYKEVDINLL